MHSDRLTRLVSGTHRHAWEDTKYCGTYLRVSGRLQRTRFRGANAPAHRVCCCPGVGGSEQGLIVAERAEVEHRRRQRRRGTFRIGLSALLSVEEAHKYLSARGSHIAVAGGLLAGCGDAVSTRGAHLSERAAR
ncbi:hypothetical protein TcYC6_0015340 [Trypanosoma cruzi]|nr:hypothetical protein TcYC6_0015340 [Trypanosoma cruzi]